MHPQGLHELWLRTTGLSDVRNEQEVFSVGLTPYQSPIEAVSDDEGGFRKYFYQKLY